MTDKQQISKTTKADPSGQDPGSLQKVYECRTLLEYLAKKYDIKGEIRIGENSGGEQRGQKDSV